MDWFLGWSGELYMQLQERHLITFPVGNLHGLVFWGDLSGLWFPWPFLYMLIKKPVELEIGEGVYTCPGIT